MSAPGGGYDVHPSDLQTGGSALTGDADEVGRAGLAAADGARDAGAACAGGALAAALNRFEVAVGSAIPGLADDVRRSAAGLQATAGQYQGDDQGSAGDVNVVVPGLTLPGR